MREGLNLDRWKGRGVDGSILRLRRHSLEGQLLESISRGCGRVICGLLCREK